LEAPVIKQWLSGLENQVLLAHITGKNRAWLLSHPEARLSPEQERTFQQAKQRLDAGEPLPYILGHWEFFGLEFEVTPEVLIPRPETELLIETALAWAVKRTQPGTALRCLDLCTGSGIIPIALATRLPEAHFTATDLSTAALAVARRNAQKHGVSDQIRFIEADLFPPGLELSGFQLATANPPYIPTATLEKLPIYGREPTLALDGGRDGLNLIRRVLAGLAAKAAPGSLILVEIESGQGSQVRELAKNHFPGQNIQILQDLAGLDRLLRVEIDLLWTKA
jgi:release factor glutamine methyltransferase